MSGDVEAVIAGVLAEHETWSARKWLPGEAPMTVTCSCREAGEAVVGTCRDWHHAHVAAAIAQAVTRDEGEAVEQAGIAAAHALVEDERARQRGRWTDAHDAEHGPQPLLAAAECYEAGRHMPRWPWKTRYWKPGQERRNLVKAGALFQAAADTAPRRLAFTDVIAKAIAGRTRCEKALGAILVSPDADLLAAPTDDVATSRIRAALTTPPEVTK